MQRVKIIPFNGVNGVLNAVAYLQKCGFKSVGVLDGDQSQKTHGSYIRCLPGKKAPEKEIFLSKWGINEMKGRYGFDLIHHISTLPKPDHHDFSKFAHKETGASQETIEVDCIRAYIENQSADFADDLLEWIEGHA